MDDAKFNQLVKREDWDGLEEEVAVQFEESAVNICGKMGNIFCHVHFSLSTGMVAQSACFTFPIIKDGEPVAFDTFNSHVEQIRKTRLPRRVSL